MSGDDPDMFWAHILWQRHGLRMEEFDAMTELQKIAYIASEELAIESRKNRRRR